MCQAEKMTKQVTVADFAFRLIVVKAVKTFPKKSVDHQNNQYLRPGVFLRSLFASPSNMGQPLQIAPFGKHQ